MIRGKSAELPGRVNLGKSAVAPANEIDGGAFRLVSRSCGAVLMGMEFPARVGRPSVQMGMIVDRVEEVDALTAAQIALT